MNLLMNFKVFPAGELLFACRAFVFESLRFGHLQTVLFVRIFRFMRSHVFNEIRTKSNYFLAYVTRVGLIVLMEITRLGKWFLQTLNIFLDFLPYTWLHVYRNFWMILTPSYIDYILDYCRGRTCVRCTVPLFEMEFYTHYNICADCAMKQFYLVLCFGETFSSF